MEGSFGQESLVREGGQMQVEELAGVLDNSVCFSALGGALRQVLAKTPPGALRRSQTEIPPGGPHGVIGRPKPAAMQDLDSEAGAQEHVEHGCRIKAALAYRDDRAAIQIAQVGLQGDSHAGCKILGARSMAAGMAAN
jgi:hypothetical protein